MSFGGFLGLGEEEHTIPWNALTFDTSLGGYRTAITEQQLRERQLSIGRRVTPGTIASGSKNFTTTLVHLLLGSLSFFG
jgi:hypothetical protein